LYLVLQALLVIRLPEHLAHIEAVGLGELPGRLSRVVRVEDCLHSVRDVAGVLCGGNICLCSVLLYRGNNLRDFKRNRLFRVFDFFNLLVGFLRHIRQRVLEVHHTVVGCAVGALFYTVFIGDSPGSHFAVTEGVSEVIRC
jgi:hypothetical protein